MRRISFQTIFLAITILVSIFLSYVLMFNNTIISRWLTNQETVQINIQNDSTSIVLDYYQLANVRMNEVIYPTNVVISQNEQAHLLNNYGVLQDLVQMLTQRRITATGTIEIPERDDYLTLITQERVEVEFPAVIPFGVIEHFIKNESDETEFNFNRIIFPLQNNKNEVYLVNTLEQIYMKAKMPEGTSSNDYLNIVNAARDNWVAAKRYDLSNLNHVYLPSQAVTVPTQLYTIETVPESNILGSTFGNSRVWQLASTEEDASRGLVSYYNSNIELRMNILSQMMSIQYRSVLQDEAKNYAQKIEQSFNQIRQYEYWENGLRYVSQPDMPTLVYQRYLNGYPIFSTSSVNHYAFNRVAFRGGNLNSSIASISMSRIYSESHIADNSQPHEMLNAEQLVAELGEAGFDIADFSSIVIGYEWQEDMAEFQKVSFIPKWFFEINNVFYTLEQIKNGEINSVARPDSQPTEEGGEQDGF